MNDSTQYGTGYIVTTSNGLYHPRSMVLSHFDSARLMKVVKETNENHLDRHRRINPQEFAVSTFLTTYGIKDPKIFVVVYEVLDQTNTHASLPYVTSKVCWAKEYDNSTIGRVVSNKKHIDPTQMTGSVRRGSRGDISYLNFFDQVLDGMDFLGIIMDGCLHYQCSYIGADMRLSSHENSIFLDCVLDDVKWNNANLLHTSFVNCHINNMDSFSEEFFYTTEYKQKSFAM